jgi:hypothetical protein
VAVDATGAATSGYTLTAFLRAILPRHAICDPTLLSSRCSLGIFCVDRTNDGTPRCEDMPASVNVNTGDLAHGCDTAVKLGGDGVVLGTLDSASDVDVVELAPSTDVRLRVVVDDMAGGCAVDSRLELATGDACAGAALVPGASDDNSGLGPCPLLDDIALTGGQRYWLRIRLAANAPVPASPSYAMVVDLY